jgi:hypothetical protein
LRFDRRITLGNLLTILAGIVSLATGAAYFSSRLNAIEVAVNDVRCTLAAAGIAQTTSPCTLPASRWSRP